MVKQILDILRQNKKKLMVGAVVAFFLFLIGTAGVIQITSQPRFCNSCHYMNSYYEQWKTSSHSKFSCLKCHINPGIKNKLLQKFSALHEVVSMMTGKYPSRPHAQVDDAACLRPGCHEKRLLAGKDTLPNGIVFDHTPHLTQERRGRHLRCTSCHAQMVMGSHMAVTEEVCFLCHFKDRVDGKTPMPSEFCQKCHSKVPDNIKIHNSGNTFSHSDYVGKVLCQDCHIGVVQGNGEVPPVMCSQCHTNPENLKRINDHVFMHENHVTNHKVECYRCHSQIKHTLVRDTRGNSGVSCGQCHSATADLYRGTGAKGVDSLPSSMFQAQVSCIACHPGKGANHNFGPETQKQPSVVSRCEVCHGEDGAGFLKDWKQQLQAGLRETETLLARARTVSPKDPAAKSLREEAENNISFVKSARGLHNLEYSLSILEHSRENLKKALSGK